MMGKTWRERGETRIFYRKYGNGEANMGNLLIKWDLNVFGAFSGVFHPVLCLVLLPRPLANGKEGMEWAGPGL